MSSRLADGLSNDLRVCFGANLRVARLQAGLKQGDIEARTGIKQHYVSQIENGKMNPTLSTLAQLAVCVGKPVSLMLRPAQLSPIPNKDRKARPRGQSRALPDDDPT